jgi:hypothetical protein
MLMEVQWQLGILWEQQVYIPQAKNFSFHIYKATSPLLITEALKFIILVSVLF